MKNILNTKTAEALKKKPPIPITAQMQDHVMTLAKIPARKFYTDARALVEAYGAVSEYYNMNVTFSADVYNGEAEAMGQKIVYSDKAMPSVDQTQPLIKKHGDLDKIKVPDWKTAGRIPYFLETFRLAREMGGEASTFCAPLSLAVMIRSYPLLIRDMRKNPEFVHDLFTFLVDEILSSYLTTIQEAAGASMAYGVDAWGSFPVLSPALIEKWVVPYAERLRNNMASQGIMPMIVGSADYCEEDVERFDESIMYECLELQGKVSGIPNLYGLFNARWHEFPLEPVVKFLAMKAETSPDYIYTQGLNARLLRDGPKEDIVKTIKTYIHLFGRKEGALNILLANIPADTPTGHVHAALDAVRIYGQYPIAEDLDAVEFQLPEHPTFDEFMKGDK